MASHPDKESARIAFEATMASAQAVAFNGSPEQVAEAVAQVVALMKDALAHATALVPDGKSTFHVQVMLEMASAMASLGEALQDRTRLEDALRRCDAALQLSVAIGTPEPRLEAEGLFLRGNLLGSLGDLDAGIAHLQEVIAVMTPAVAEFAAMRESGNPAASVMLDLTGEDEKARTLLSDALAALAAIHGAQAARAGAQAKRPWWQFWG